MKWIPVKEYEGDLCTATNVVIASFDEDGLYDHWHSSGADDFTEITHVLVLDKELK